MKVWHVRQEAAAAFRGQHGLGANPVIPCQLAVPEEGREARMAGWVKETDAA